MQCNFLVLATPTKIDLETRSLLCDVSAIAWTFEVDSISTMLFLALG